MALLPALLAAFAAALAAALALGGRSSSRLPPPRPCGTPPRGPSDGRAAGSGPRWRLVAAAGAGVGVFLLVPGAVALPAAATVAAVVWWRSAGWESAASRRRREQLEAQLPHVVDLMVAAPTKSVAARDTKSGPHLAVPRTYGCSAQRAYCPSAEYESR